MPSLSPSVSTPTSAARLFASSLFTSASASTSASFLARFLTSTGPAILSASSLSTSPLFLLVSGSLSFTVSPSVPGVSVGENLTTFSLVPSFSSLLVS